MTGGTSFIFEDPSSVVREADFVARLRAGIHGKEALLAELEHVLDLPGYFGRNWDALSECLRDFHWRPERRIVLVHSEVPTLPPAESRIYLEVLDEAIRDWRESDEHELAVLFPKDAIDGIQRMLKHHPDD
jgi:RNAse (barnase) inhibitor barstar